MQPAPSKITTGKRVILTGSFQPSGAELCVMLQRLVLFLATQIPSVPPSNSSVRVLSLQVKGAASPSLPTRIPWHSHKPNLILPSSRGSIMASFCSSPCRVPSLGISPSPFPPSTDGRASLPAPSLLSVHLCQHCTVCWADIMQRGRAVLRHPGKDPGGFNCKCAPVPDPARGSM